MLNKRQTHKRVNSKLINTKYENSVKGIPVIKVAERKADSASAEQGYPVSASDKMSPGSSGWFC